MVLGLARPILRLPPNSAKKPPRGKGLNVPSTISLQNSWPRGKDKRTPVGEKTGPRLKKHIDRLQKVPNTKFVNYEKDTGVWTFQVDHFTTYALDLDDDETDAVDDVQLFVIEIFLLSSISEDFSI